MKQERILTPGNGRVSDGNLQRAVANEFLPQLHVARKLEKNPEPRPHMKSIKVESVGLAGTVFFTSPPPPRDSPNLTASEVEITILKQEAKERWVWRGRVAAGLRRTESPWAGRPLQGGDRAGGAPAGRV